MEDKSMNCTSCNLHVQASKNFVKFKCPGCNDEDVIRCNKCRANGVKYVCKKCRYEGP